MPPNSQPAAILQRVYWSGSESAWRLQAKETVTGKVVVETTCLLAVFAEPRGYCVRQGGVSRVVQPFFRAGVWGGRKSQAVRAKEDQPLEILGNLLTYNYQLSIYLSIYQQLSSCLPLEILGDGGCCLVFSADYSGSGCPLPPRPPKCHRPAPNGGRVAGRTVWGAVGPFRGILCDCPSGATPRSLGVGRG